MICTTYFLTFFSELIPPTGNIILSQNIRCVLNLNSNFCVKTVIYETGEGFDFTGFLFA